ncbi:serine hydrolase domain-containing protein [Egicoccus sp. AB-alg2]|uniref:serine hydrolase domain-containing protein n=1 Tax=Egicoccus sp. AB-alg2 TaxID=3242693 RepID=UPI00359EA12E
MSSRRLVQLLVSAAVAVSLLASPVVAAAAAEPIAPERLDAWITERMDAHGIPGAAVAVVQGGRTVHLGGYGSADGADRPVTETTPFLIGSASKPFTANVVLQLVDEERLSLDEPAWPYISDFVPSPPDGFEDATIRQLLTHTAGLGMSVGLPGTVPVHTSADALERRVADMLAQPLAAPPGERYEYANSGYAVLAAVVEQVTGQRFDEVLRERILDPLGMQDTFATDDHPAASRLASGHRQWFGSWRPADLPFDRAGVAYGYLGSTAADLATFLQAHFDGESPAIPRSAAQIADGPTMPSGWDLPLEANQGLGWMVDELAGHQVVSHAGSLGHFTTHLILVPGADDLGIAVATNASAFVAAGHTSQYDLSVGLTELLLGQEGAVETASPLTVLVAPIVTWLLLAALVGLAVRHLVTTLPRWRRAAATGTGRRWLRRVVLPAAGWLSLALGLSLSLPLGAARHFYPDVGWAATAIVAVALPWAVIRTAVTIAALRPRATA